MSVVMQIKSLGIILWVELEFREFITSTIRMVSVLIHGQFAVCPNR